MSTPCSLTIATLCVLCVVGCNDPTYEQRKSLAIGLDKALTWQHPDLDSIPEEYQRMHLGAGDASATADVLEECLETAPPFDDDLLAIIGAYAEKSRRLEAQYRQAIADGRSELNEEEQAIADDYGKASWLLYAEILERIKYDEIAAAESD